jgi:hypothetical protein
VTFDPWYSIDGLEAFLSAALEASPLQRPAILLSFNLGALTHTYEEFGKTLNKFGYSVAEWHPLSNLYPVPRGIQRSIEAAEFLTGLLCFKPFFPIFQNDTMYFSSDLLLLIPKDPAHSSQG